MKNIKNISLFLLAFMTFTQIHSSENQAVQDSQSLEFPKHTTEKYMYNKSVETKTPSSIYTTLFGKHPDGMEIEDKTYEDFFSSRVNRKRVEMKTENGVSVITTETWTSRNPSYITWVNGALVVSAIASIALGATTLNALGNNPELLKMAQEQLKKQADKA